MLAWKLKSAEKPGEIKRWCFLMPLCVLSLAFALGPLPYLGNANLITTPVICPHPYREEFLAGMGQMHVDSAASLKSLIPSVSGLAV